MSSYLTLYIRKRKGWNNFFSLWDEKRTSKYLSQFTFKFSSSIWIPTFVHFHNLFLNCGQSPWKCPKFHVVIHIRVYGIWLFFPFCLYKIIKISKCFIKSEEYAMLIFLVFFLGFRHFSTVDSIYIFYEYFHYNCSNDISSFLLRLYYYNRSTWLATWFQDFPANIIIYKRNMFSNCFFFWTSYMWNPLPSTCFPATFNLKIYISISRVLNSCVFLQFSFLNRLFFLFQIFHTLLSTRDLMAILLWLGRNDKKKNHT